MSSSSSSYTARKQHLYTQLSVLSMASCPVASRMSALRAIQAVLQEPGISDSIDAGMRSKINECVMDNILKIILAEERTHDQRRRQLIRTECFLVLASILENTEHFASINDETMAKVESHLAGTIDVDDDDDGDPRLNAPTLAPMAPSEAKAHELVGMESGQAAKLLYSSMSMSNLSSSLAAMAVPSSPLSLKSSNSQTFSSLQAEKRLTSAEEFGDDFDYEEEKKPIQFSPGLALKNVESVYAASRKKTNFRFKPRPTIMFGSEFEQEHIYKKGEKNNWIDQDAKLGYQKPKMWYPLPMVPVTSALVPTERPDPREAVLTSDKIVQEYMQMRALSSYVGDLVEDPFDRRRRGQIRHRKLGVMDPLGSASIRKEGMLPRERFREVAAEVAKLWSPLLGIAGPIWERLAAAERPGLFPTGQRLKIKAAFEASAREYDDEEPSARYKGGGQGYHGTYLGNGVRAKHPLDVSAVTLRAAAMKRQKTKGSSKSPTKGLSDNTSIVTGITTSTSRSDMSNRDSFFNQPLPETEKSILFTRDTLRKLMRKELSYQNQAKAALRSGLTDLASKRDSYGGDLIAWGERISDAYGEQYAYTMASKDTINTLMKETVKLHYAALPPRYLCVLEGSKANPRQIVMKATLLFFRERRRNMLHLAMGIWKIGLVEAASQARRPLYWKRASCHIMAMWMKNRSLRRQKLWFWKWVRQITKAIFYHRVKSVLPIQTRYRQWRDRQRFILLHDIAAYGGPLSDIYLGPPRPDIQYFIPARIRSERRMFWLACTVVQARYRGLLARRLFYAMRAQLVLIQSVLRMYPYRERYKLLRKTSIRVQAYMRRTLTRILYLRLKKICIVVQKYIRRWEAKVKVFNGLQVKYLLKGIPYRAVILIQTRWREFLARRRVWRLKTEIDKRYWAALIFQRYWYRFKGAFVTFLLMGVYRELSRDERDLEDKLEAIKRKHYASVLQRYYAVRYMRRLMDAVVKTQGWFRGVMGKDFVAHLRLIKWASRKLHWWARVKMKNTHAHARTLQLWWWKRKPGRLLRHLGNRLRRRDKSDDYEDHEEIYLSASRIQATVRGIWCRRWVKRHRAAMKIQKPLKFFLARKRFKRMIRERNLAVVRKYVGKVIGRGLVDRVHYLIKLHSNMMIPVQAMVRGWVIRKILNRIRAYAIKMGRASIVVQRFWRSQGVMVRAVQEVLAMQRIGRNPFFRCDSIHRVFLQVTDSVQNLYTVRDPRCGLKIKSFLQRLGFPEYAPMFPSSRFPYATDLRSMTDDRLIALFKQWQVKQQKAAEAKGLKVPKDVPIPKKFFADLLAITTIPIYPTELDEVARLKKIYPIQEVMTPEALATKFKEIFQKRFGTNLQSRMNNIVAHITEEAWGNGKYSNYRLLTGVITEAQVVRALEKVPTAGDVQDTLMALCAIDTEITVEQRAWEAERVKNAANYLQLAAERCLLLMKDDPDHTIKKMIFSASDLVSNFQRRFKFVHSASHEKAKNAGKDKDKKGKGGQPGAKDKEAGKGKKEKGKPAPDADISAVEAPKRGKGKVPAAAVEAEVEIEMVIGKTEIMDYEAILSSKYTDNELVTAHDSLNIELNLIICRIYFRIFDKLYVATKGIQAIKDKRSITIMRRILKENRLKRFLESSMHQYQEGSNIDKAYLEWQRLKRIAESVRKFTEMFEESVNRRLAVENDLKWLPRFGWSTLMDADGYPYYVHDEGKFDSTYEMPMYTFEEWRVIKAVQKRVRITLKKLAEWRKYKEELLEKQIKESRMMWAIEIARGQKLLKFRLRLKDHDMEELGVASKAPIDESAEDEALPQFSETFLPLHLQFEDHPTLVNGQWALLNSADGSTYEVCIVLNVRKNGTICDARNTKGVKSVGIPVDRIALVRFDVGLPVECRYRKGKHFYRGRISGSYFFDGQTVYNVLYNDGEREYGIHREMIRMCKENLPLFLAERDRYIGDADKRVQRQRWYYNLKKVRLKETGKQYLSELNFINLKKAAEQKAQRKAAKAAAEAEAAKAKGGKGAREETKEAPGLASAIEITERFKKGRGGDEGSVDSDDESSVRREDINDGDGDGDGDLDGDEEPREAVEASTKIKYTRVALQFGWSIVRTFKKVDGNEDRKSVV